MKLGCIGYGNMATAILGGLAQKKLLPTKDVFVYDPNEQRLEEASANGFSVAHSENEIIKNADMVLLAVKPKDFPPLFQKIDNEKNAEKVIFVSIAAGISIRKITELLGKQAPVVRVMPNTPLLLSAGTTALCHNHLVSAETFAFAKNIFACAGTVYELPEEQFNDVINLNGSSPAYIYLFAKIVAEFAVKNGGIPYDTALSMFSDTLKGSAEMLLRSGKTPDELIRAVSSPGGTTVAALNGFEETGFQQSLETGLLRCVQRAEEMGK